VLLHGSRQLRSWLIFNVSQKEMTRDAQLDGKRALIEVREGRRWHRFVVATLKKEADGLFAIFPEPYPQHRPEPAKIKVPEEHASLFAPVKHRDYELKFQSVLHRIHVESDDTVACARAPIIITQADIDAAKNEKG
jgi:hypothetical protein